jgi:hypothetical protein
MSGTQLALDALHDLYTDAKGQLVSAPTPLDQRISCRLKTFQGEYWIDITLGIPYFTEILKKNPDMAVIRSLFASEIQKVIGVKTLESCTASLDRANRRLLVEFKCTGTDDLTYYSTTEVSL